jgi:hypothetical protein
MHDDSLLGACSQLDGELAASTGLLGSSLFVLPEVSTETDLSWAGTAQAQWTVVQTLWFCWVIVLGIPALMLLSTIDSSGWSWPIRVLAFSLGLHLLNLLLTLQSVVVMWAFTGRILAGSKPANSYSVQVGVPFQYTTVHAVHFSFFGVGMYESSCLHIAFLRCLGATIGQGSYIDTLCVRDWDLLSLGEEVLASPGVVMIGHELSAGWYSTQSVEVGSGCVLEAKSTIYPRSKLKPNSIVGMGSLVSSSFLQQESHDDEQLVLIGIPAQLSAQQSGNKWPVLTKDGYSTCPALEELQCTYETPKDSTNLIPDFQLIREGVGRVTWTDRVCLWGVNLDCVEIQEGGVVFPLDRVPQLNSQCRYISEDADDAITSTAFTDTCTSKTFRDKSV